jgi:peptidoglycan hydrolase-like protein with peptidoglycan-binding domain
MTPGQARTALLSFVLLLAGVAINALFMQAGGQAGPPGGSRTAAERGPARPMAERGRKPPETSQASRTRPRASSAAAEEPSLRIARFAPDMARLDSLPGAAVEPADAETVHAIQRELKQRGYGPLAGDGSMGLPTRAAIMAYEHDQGLVLTGEASEQLLKRILLGASPGVESPGARKVGSVQAEQVIRSVQQWLAVLGYRAVRVDGRFGEDTVKAIRDFEMDKGLVPRGRVSAELVVRLSDAAVAASRPAGR